MIFEDEKDFIMRLIKEMVRMLVSFIIGKQYAQVETLKENPYGVSDDKLSMLRAMVDRGDLNEAENLLLERVDCGDREAVAELIFFYDYAGGKDAAFLAQHDYSREEVLDGLRQLAGRLGCESIATVLEEQEYSDR